MLRISVRPYTRTFKWFANRIKSIDVHVADRWGRLQAQSERSLPAIDSLIVATALYYDFTLLTRNTRDFDFRGLQVINPWELAFSA